MKITPTLPPPLPPGQPENRSVTAVQAPRRSPDATEENPARRAPGQAVIDESRRARIVARAETLATPQRDPASRAGRALNAYAQVAGQRERNSLQDLLGFDDYA